MEKPAVFIASSVEGLAYADSINVNLDHDAHCTLWRNNTFMLGSDGLGDLIKKSSAVDFAIFVFTPDDIVNMRDKVLAVARDNVVFELGLFIGALGRERCYVVKPRGVDMHLPSDLAGITTADYAADRPDGDIASALNAACTHIKKRIAELGVIPRAPQAKAGGTARHVANPPDYKLSDTDLEFLSQCVRSHIAYPSGLAFHSIANFVHADEHLISLAALKLTRLGFIEKSVDVDQDDNQYFAYRSTEDGLDAFLKNEDRYESMRSNGRKGRGAGRYGSRPPAPPAAQTFDDMDGDIPF